MNLFSLFFKKRTMIISIILASTGLISAGEFIAVPSLGITSISQAMMTAKSGDTVLVADGIYKEKIFIKAGVALVARNNFRAIINGGGKGTVVTMSTHSTIKGFKITNGTIGVFSKDPDNSIVSCLIINNWETGIICVRHLPRIEDNIIAFNRASGIQGWNLRSTSTTINHNTIAFNRNNGVALGGASEVILENNMITFNERFGVKLSHNSEKTILNKNNLYGNLSLTSKLPADNSAFDPKYHAPKTALDFTVESKLPCCAFGSDNKIIGARLEN
jgi:parallel beta-helix repeat protein